MAGVLIITKIPGHCGGVVVSSDALLTVVGMQSWSNTPIPSLDGSAPPLRLYDTADRQVRPVTPGAT
ncbi:MAG: hypothetical protein ACRCSF_04075, partial [Mycobacteriaceae bacterium]